MTPLKRLQSLLRPATNAAAKDMRDDHRILDEVCSELGKRLKSGDAKFLDEDRRIEAVKRFWQSKEVESFRDAFLLSWSVCLPHRTDGPCILQNEERLKILFDAVDDWLDRPASFRRCYQGLVAGYFSYEPPGPRENGRDLLRDYLGKRNAAIRSAELNPEWVEAATVHKRLFGNDPYGAYVEPLLRGDTQALDYVCRQLGIDKASWFLKELVLRQVQAACSMNDKAFLPLLEQLVRMLAANEVLRDRGMMWVLDRYAQIPERPIHQHLRDRAVEWWGNPWLPSNEMRWGGVLPQTRTMVSNWLKQDLIGEFFVRLAEDGFSEPRRMKFWQRWSARSNQIEFAIGSQARNLRDPDMVKLRRKMDGLLRELEDGGRNNALIMQLDHLVFVEFSGLGNACYVYDAKRALPFDTTKRLRLMRDAHNSLKTSTAMHRLLHSSRQFDTWEQEFEHFMKHNGIKSPDDLASPRSAFGLTTSVAKAPPNNKTESLDGQRALAAASALIKRPTDFAPSPTQAAEPEFDLTAFYRLVREHGLRSEDNRAKGGSLWLMPDEVPQSKEKQLRAWGFARKPGRGWWKSE